MTGPRLGDGAEYLIGGYPAEPELSGLAGFAGSAIQPVAGGRIIVIGTVAGHIARSAQLQVALEEAGLSGWVADVAPTLAACAARSDWDLAIVLSPHKQAATSICDTLSPAAHSTGVVDTLVRTREHVLGVTTNSFAIEAVVHRLVPPDSTAIVQIVGTGATARCAIAAVRRCCPGAVIALAGRTAPSVVRMAEEFGLLALTEPVSDGVVMTIHATTWGETEDSEREPLVPDLLSSLGAGQTLFDLNNRVSSLQVTALNQGCVVVGGRFMQRLVHVQRAWMLRAQLVTPS